MTFQEQGAELNRLEALAKTHGMSAAAFERIALDVTHEAYTSSLYRTPEQTLAEIRRRIEPPGTKKPGVS